MRNFWGGCTWRLESASTRDALLPYSGETVSCAERFKIPVLGIKARLIFCAVARITSGTFDTHGLQPLLGDIQARNLFMSPF